MKVIPNQMDVDNNSNAERKVFNALKSCHFNTGKNIALHSLLLPKHDYKRVGEADFVIVCNYGLFVLEVKGGGIKQEDGQWFTIDRNKKEHKISNPFEQAKSAVHSIDNTIKEYLNIKQTRIPLGYAVVFPNVQWTKSSAEWSDEMVCDSLAFRDFKIWLLDLFDYWNKRPANANLLSDYDVEQIANFLRPNFEGIQPLFAQVDDIKQKYVRLTEEQFQYVTIAMSNKRVICGGGAGTGKTFLAAETARRFIEQDKSVLLVCKSEWLKHYLRALIPSEKIIISTISGLSNTLRRTMQDQFDVLIVDEGQDILNYDDLTQLNEVIVGGFSEGNWHFFHDSKNQSGILGKTNQDVLKWLSEQGNPTILPLSVNCRNTSNILTNIQNYLQCDLEKPALTNGPEVTEFRGDKAELADQLDALLVELDNSELDNGSITILSANRKRKSLLSLIEQDHIKNIIELDSYSVEKYQFENITFAEIKDFKGLENDVIILLDLKDPQCLTETESRSLHYVGMSRARVKLYCFWE